MAGAGHTRRRHIFTFLFIQNLFTFKLYSLHVGFVCGQKMEGFVETEKAAHGVRINNLFNE